jgi:hypothetical protein
MGAGFLTLSFRFPELPRNHSLEIFCRAGSSPPARPLQRPPARPGPGPGPGPRP